MSFTKLNSRRLFMFAAFISLVFVAVAQSAVPTNSGIWPNSSRYGWHPAQTVLIQDSTSATDTTIVFQSFIGTSAVPRTVIKSVTLTPGGSLVGAATNTRHLNLLWSADGATWTEVANVDFVSGTNATSGTPIALYTPTAPGLTLVANGVLAIEGELVGAGIAGFPSFLVTVVWEGR